MKKRRVVRRRPTNQTPLERWKERLKPANLKAFFTSKEGAIFVAKVAGGGLLLIFLVFLYFAKDLPSPNKVNAIVNAQTTKLWDRTHTKVLYEVYGDKNRTIIDFKQMPDNIKQATIAVEDKNFYKHGAFSFLGIFRAAFADLFCHCGLQGGSTITQQYVKNALLTPQQSLSRKIKELILSMEIESFYSKDDILKLYLNEIPYGNQAYGIEAACKTYFPYHATGDSQPCAPKLTLDEAALLAAIPRAPTYYSPYGSHVQTDLIPRQHIILDLMAEQHYITADQAKAAYAEKAGTLKKMPPTPQYLANVTAPHFVMYVQEQLEAKYGVQAVEEGGLDITTTLDLHQQQLAEKAIADNMNRVHNAGGSNAALVSADPNNGEVLSMVGSYNFSDPKFGAFNVATAQRQPGSSFKPFVYATGFGKDYNFGPGSTIYNVITDFGGGYKPRNFPGDPSSSVESVRSSLGNSLNVPAVKMLYMVGVTQAINQAHKMGITTLNDDPQNYGLSLVLGSGEVKLIDMVNAYESFANGGLHYSQTYVLKVVDSKRNTLEEYKPPKTPPRVLDPQVAYLMNNVLADINAKRPAFNPDLGYFQFPGHVVAAKTGTTEHFGDAWTMGYSPGLVTGVWVGNNDNVSMRLQAADIAAPIFHAFMSPALAGKPNQGWPQPPGIKKVTLDANTGRLPAPGAKGPTRTDLFPSWYKPMTPSDTSSARIDKVSGKLATDCTPPLAVDTAYASEIHAEIPPSDPAYSRWEGPVAALARALGYQAGGQLPTQSDDVHHCDDQKPTVKLKATSKGGGSYSLQSTWTSGTFTVNKLDVMFDDQVISTQNVSQGNGTYTFDYDAPSGGNHTFKAIVTDTGLYQAEDDFNVSVAGGGGSGPVGISPDGGTYHMSGGNITFSWTSRGGTDHYKLTIQPQNGGPSQSFDNIPSTTKQINPVTAGLTPGDYDWFVQAIATDDSVLGTSSQKSFTITSP